MPEWLFLPIAVPAIQWNLQQVFLAQMHQNYIDHQPMEPSRKRRFTSEKWQSCGRVARKRPGSGLGLIGVMRHAQTNSINPLLVGVEERFERLLVAALSARDKFTSGSGLLWVIHLESVSLPWSVRADV